MISYYIVLLGIVQMFFCLFLVRRIMKLMDNDRLRNDWNVIFGLVCFFLLGYALYFYFLSRTITDTELSRLLISLILCFGASFVIIVLLVIKTSISSLTFDKKNVLNSNKALKASETKIKSMEKKIEQKNKELENTLEDFYTLRLEMGKDKRTEKENRKIKARIEKIKKGF
ncbi:MAG: hypothetical protein V1660_02580 [archaeon]